MKKLISLAIMSFLSHQLLAQEQIQSRKIDNYTAIIKFDPELANGTLLIKKEQSLVYKQGEIGSHYFWGLDDDQKDVYSGKDLTGNKAKNLVVTNWTGGANCCYQLSIFELGKKFRKLIEIDAMTTLFEIKDLDNDKVPEIEFWDGSIKGVFASTAATAYGRVVMKFIDGNYKVYSDLMRKPVPNAKEINKIKQKIVTSFKDEYSLDLPHEFLKNMMDLSYSGHLDLALKIADETWPKERKGLSKFKEDFVACLNESEYWKEFSKTTKKD